jgi:Arc/MetJ-type ribon-helix-helix transcriptional regulator
MKTWMKTANIALPSDLHAWCTKKIGAGYNTLSEVIREALRNAREAEARDYLNPPPLPPGTMAKIYARQTKEERDTETRLARRAVRKPETR